MNSPIWRLAGIGVLCLGLSAQSLADDNDQRGPQPRPQGGPNPQAQTQHMQQQVQQQQREQQQELRGQQQQMQQQIRNQQQQVQQQQQQQQRELQQQQRGLQQELRGQQQQQQPNTAWQQRQQEFNQRQAERQAEQQNRLQQNRASPPIDNRAQPNGPAIQGKPGVVWQTQPPIRGNNEGPRGNYGGGRPDDRNWDNRRGGNGWGPGPQYRPGYTVDRFPDREYRVPYRGQDFFYSGGYWYRPQGPRYVVVAPPYGIRTRALPDYATRMWIGGAMFFLAAGTYYQYMDDTQDYVVVNPPQGVPQSQPVPAEPSDGLDVAFYPANGQSPSQMEQDRYDCQRYAAQQSGFDPATATYAPADSVAYLYRQNMGNCLASRGYQVN